MHKKFIPNGDFDFVTMAESFARVITREPSRFNVSDADVASMNEAVGRFREALNMARRNGTRSQVATAEKESARVVAEKILRRIAHSLRHHEALTEADRIALRLRVRKGKPTVLHVPNEAPRLKFVRAIHDAGAVPIHELQFWSLDYKPKPEGAVRLELFVDLIGPDEKVPVCFGAARGGSRPIYLRSYNKSPIRVMPPMAKTPMRVVYWARWADAAGEVGPFSETVEGWVEGGSHHMMGPMFGHTPRPMVVEVSERPEMLDTETTVIVALLEAQRSRLPRIERVESLPEPEPRQVRQIEGPEAA